MAARIDAVLTGNCVFCDYPTVYSSLAGDPGRTRCELMVHLGDFSSKNSFRSSNDHKKNTRSDLIFFMTRSGRVPNHLPHDLGVKIINGGNESRRNYFIRMIFTTAGIVKSRWRYRF